MKTHLNIKIYGLVQGVFFRKYTQDKTHELNIKGFAKNMPDGSVYIEAEGKKENLDKFIKWCNSGPTMAEVEKTTVSEALLKNFTEFEIL